MSKFAGAAQAASGSVREVVSNQDGPYKDLEKQVRKYAAAEYQRPIAEHTRKAFQTVEQFVDRGGAINVILDSGCGTGESSIHLAQKFPGVPVIGIDKSAERLTKAGNEKQLEQAADGLAEIPANVFWCRAELLDFWRLALEKVEAGEWNVVYHALYYPNPWPKESEATRRFHLHPIFPTLLKLGRVTELRTNWEIYAREYEKSARIAGGILSVNLSVTCGSFDPVNPETAFERKYSLAGQTLWKVVTDCQSPC